MSSLLLVAVIAGASGALASSSQDAIGKARRLEEDTGTIEFQFPTGFQPFGNEPITMEVEEADIDDLNELQTIIVNDKSKGTTWLLHPKTQKVVAVELPFPGGNHESAVAPQSNKIAVPHYETAESVGVNEGGGTPGSSVSLIDIDKGSASVLVNKPNAFRDSKPHDAAWLSETLLVTTEQLSNGLTLWDLSNQTSTAIELGDSCSTPHLLVVVPTSDVSGKQHLVATTCRCTNPGDSSECPGAIALVNVTTGESIVLEAPLGAEAITATKYGEIWVGGFRSDIVSVYGSPDENPVSLDNFELIEEKRGFWKPLRMAYDDVTDTVVVATLASTDATVLAGLSDADHNFFSFDAAPYNGTRQLLHSTTLSSRKRGRINPEGLAVAPDTGYFITGGFDTATIVIVDAETLNVVASIYLPHCTLPSEMALATFLPFLNNTAMVATLNLTGTNNWSGGYCARTLRNTYDNRFTVLDGFNYAAIDPTWTIDEEGEDVPATAADSDVVVLVLLVVVGVVVLIAFVNCIYCSCWKRRNKKDVHAHMKVSTGDDDIELA
eukprot:CAMPEP_0202713824 /NCGR_PEP_ID=MMETSP1385-20130828/60028_1 /ASSEMBLY_ACC=CAM_ASM_000861 /TAXON_ID=933848 /ORGANISM="Elphidium margaritaceum" /LENGTH=550 /DNA_ID=CAMNT_0049374329 /DNA_START=41 /DNA_END=1693 /DNA_ORIENTATION=+